MKRNALYIFLVLLLATALTALAQSPTTSNMGGSETKDPYGATLDHPNPGSAPLPNGQATTSTKESQAPATPATDTATTPSTSSTTSSSTTNMSGSSTPSTDTATTNNTDTTSSRQLPRTASDLPLLATIGLLALGGALTVRSIAKRNA
jgi:cobalamin biosynthesis Mg chelatase CobN